MKPKKEVEYNSKKYILVSNNKYYILKTNSNAERIWWKMLHRQIREDNFWKIPKWFHIHHKDHNTFNNDISNLEIIDSKSHQRIHMEKYFSNEENKEKNRIHLEKSREKASEWHKSKDWIEWHKKHYQNSLWKAIQNKHICDYCWIIFYNNRKDTAKYCSKKCTFEAYKIDVNCKNCWKVFKTSKYQPKKNCSRKCSAQSRSKS